MLQSAAAADELLAGDICLSHSAAHCEQDVSRVSDEYRRKR